jgi:hypothetical protein
MTKRPKVVWLGSTPTVRTRVQARSRPEAPELDQSPSLMFTPRDKPSY